MPRKTRLKKDGTVDKRQQNGRHLTVIGAPYRWKVGQSGNPKGRCQKLKLSDAITQELALRHEEDDITRAEVLASNLLDRAETDSSELKTVLSITEPELLQENSGMRGGTFAAVKTQDISVVVGKLFSD